MNLDYTRAEGISATESRHLTDNSRDENELHAEGSGQLSKPLRLLPAVFGFVVSIPFSTDSCPILSMRQVTRASRWVMAVTGLGGEGERSRRNLGPAP